MIIAILAAMQLPAISRVREQAHAMSCCNNLRQLGIGLISYDGDYGQLPAATNVAFNDSCGWSRRAPWDLVLLEHMDEPGTQVLTCPRDIWSKESTVSSMAATTFTGRKSYAMPGSYGLASEKKAWRFCATQEADVFEMTYNHV